MLEKKILSLTAVQETQLEKAYEACEGLGCSGIRDYTVICVESLGDTTLGAVLSGKIYLSSRAFNMGTKALASTLFEESTHLEHGLDDLTYEMQTYLFDRIVGLYEELQGAPI